jgi:hypothetical protein
MKIESSKPTILVLFAGAFLATAPLASAQEIQIKSKFDTVKLTKETYGTEVAKCIPTFSADSSFVKDHLKNFPFDGFMTHTNSSVASVFVAHQTTGLCLKLSPGKYPIYAAEAFVETVNPEGPPEKVIDGWYKQIAALIARKGSAKIAYVFGNGNAFIANYSVESDRPYRLSYSTQFNKAGAWENEKLDAKFTHASLSNISETKRDGQGVKPYVLLHRD